jgi:hypothetical protein
MGYDPRLPIAAGDALSARRGITSSLTAQSIDVDLIDVAPFPIFAWLERLDYRVIRLMEVPGGVLVFGIIAAADVPARQADAQVNPAIARFEAIFTTPRARLNLVNHIQVGTLLLAHWVSVI